MIMQAEILLTLKLQQRLFADPRRIALLKQIDQTGSISQGAKNAGISYKSAWDAINEMNQLSEQPWLTVRPAAKAAAARSSPATGSG
jgi:molybdate transport system regulatory protein